MALVYVYYVQFNCIANRHRVAFAGREHIIREALHLNQNYQPISNMPPKHARQFISIPSGNGSLGGKQGRGVGRGSGNDEDERNSIPLSVPKSNLIPQKRNAEVAPEKEPKRAAKAPAKTATTVVTRDRDQDPKCLVKGRVAEVSALSLRPKIYKQLTLPTMVP